MTEMVVVLCVQKFEAWSSYCKVRKASESEQSKEEKCKDGARRYLYQKVEKQKSSACPPKKR